MSWGGYWMFYRCPLCGKRFKAELAELSAPSFGHCPDCGGPGELVAESKAPPPDPESYEDTEA